MKTRRITRTAAVASAALLGLGLVGAGATTANAAGAPGQTTPECTQDMLAASVSPVSNSGAAGHTQYQLRLQNTSNENCHIAGYPGVSVVGHGDGTQIGNAASRLPADGRSTVLIPNASAYSTIDAVNISSDGGPLGKSCDVVNADGWRVYGPNLTKSLYAPEKGLKACAGDVDWLQVGQVHPAS